MSRVVLDTSVFIAEEQGRALEPLPVGSTAVSVVTLAELEYGVLMAADGAARAQRLRTLTRAREGYVGLSADDEVASLFAALAAESRSAGRRVPVQDTWIAATALAHDAAVCTQDADFDELEGLLELQVVRV